MTIPKTTTMLGTSSSSAKRASRVRVRQLAPRPAVGAAEAALTAAPLTCAALHSRRARGYAELNALAAVLSAFCGLVFPSNAFWICTCSSCEAAL